MCSHTQESVVQVSCKLQLYAAEFPGGNEKIDEYNNSVRGSYATSHAV
jgi:hypothetical protein